MRAERASLADLATAPGLAPGSVRRPAVRAALALLACLYSLAIYAPLVANDRPYMLDAIDVRGIAAAQREVHPLARAFVALIGESPATWEARRLPGSTMSWREAIDAEAAALQARFAILSRHARGPERGWIENGSLSLRAAARAADARRPGSGLVDAKIALSQAQRVQDEMPKVDPARPDEARAHLAYARSWPLLESLTATEVFFLVAWTLALGTWAAPAAIRAIVRRPPSSGSRGRRALLRRVVLVLGSALAVALVWRTTVGGGRPFATAPYRQAIARGDLVARRAIFPPIALGFAETNMAQAYAPPCSGRDARADQAASTLQTTHWLGTDALGRDLLARLLWGGRVSLSVGLLSALILTAIGTAVGAVAGYFGGWIDLVISRAIEVVLCFPSFLLILLVAASSDPAVLPPLVAIVLVIALVGWTSVARLARAEFLRLRDREFVLAARALGFSSARTILRHVLPNALGPVLVAASFAVASGVLIESALSYLGVGIAVPIPSWGSLINESRNPEHWWIHLFPGLAIFATVVCYNLVGEGIRDALDPRVRARAR